MIWRRSPLDWVIRFCLQNKLVVAIAVILIVGCGVLFAPFDWQTGPIQRYPVATDAIPDIGENQQIVHTDWMGRSPNTPGSSDFLTGLPYCSAKCSRH